MSVGRKILKLLQVKDFNLGINIRKIRLDHKMTQNDVVIQLQLRGRNITRSHYANIEAGLRNIYVSDFLLLKDIFKVEYNDFFVLPENQTEFPIHISKSDQ